MAEKPKEPKKGAKRGLAEDATMFVKKGASAGGKRLDPAAGPTRIVCIGASAGGLEPLELFFDSMPADTGMAFVVVQHLSPDFKSLMDELLLRHTAMAIHQVVDDMPVEPNTIYLIPSRSDMVIEGARLRLQQVPSESRLVLPIDTFMSSLADDQMGKAVAIILSGTGSDGSRGARAVQENGGLVLIQEPSTCKFDGMPRSAISEIDKALIAAPAEMPSLLCQALDGMDYEALSSYLQTTALTPDQRVLNALKRRFQTDFGLYKDNTIERRIQRRAEMHKLGNLAEYAEMVESDEAELDLLYSDLLIGVTAFFRDRQAFDELDNEVVPQLMAVMSPERQIRIWVPGCATGEEAYSIAILLHQRALEAGREPNLKIFATDLHQKSLDVASSGRYPLEHVRGVAPALLEKYFERDGDAYQISPVVRRHVVFSRQNLIKDPPFTRTDLVSCRNVLIYFAETAQKRVLALFHFALRKNGYLFLGPSESLGELSDEFQPLSTRWRLFRKLRDVRLHEPTHITALALGDGDKSRSGTVDFSGPTRPGPGQRHLLPAYELLLSRHAPPSLMINRSGELVHVFGNAKDYLRFGEGLFTQRLLDHVRPDLKVALGGAIERAWRQNAVVTTKHLPPREEGQLAREAITISVEPLSDNTDRPDYLLVSLASELNQLPEPTGDLDRESGDEILELLVALNRDHGKTIIMVTHDPRAAACARRTVHLEKGQLLSDGEIGELRSAQGAVA